MSSFNLKNFIGNIKSPGPKILYRTDSIGRTHNVDRNPKRTRAIRPFFSSYSHFTEFSAETDDFFSRYRIPKKLNIFDFFLENNVSSPERSIRFTLNFQALIRTMRSIIGLNLRLKSLVLVFFVIFDNGLKIQ
jgi:hypothetical protein